MSEPVVLDARKQEEMDFHNRRERDRRELSLEEFEGKYPNQRLYSVVDESREAIADWMKQHCPGKKALDYCCGWGSTSVALAQAGAETWGIDLSDEEVESARETVKRLGLDDRTHFQVMDAEAMTFEDDSFDLIVCTGVLHHLDLTKAFPELARVLKPGGRILANEALGYNPLIQLYRRRTPALRTAWETEHILTLEQVESAKQWFDRAEVRFYHLFVLGAVPFRSTPLFRPLKWLLNGVDSIVLSIPGVRRMAWQMLFELSEPTVTASARSLASQGEAERHAH